MYQDPNEYSTVGSNTLPEKQVSQTQPSHGLQHVLCCAATELPDGREDKTRCLRLRPTGRSQCCSG